MVVTKSDYARQRNVEPSAISNWISRRKLTPPALTADGRIDVALADHQLRQHLDLIRSRGRGGPALALISMPAMPEEPAEIASLIAGMLERARTDIVGKVLVDFDGWLNSLGEKLGLTELQIVRIRGSLAQWSLNQGITPRARADDALLPQLDRDE